MLDSGYVRKWVLLVLAFLGIFTPAAKAAGPFEQGNLQGSVAVGTGTAFSQDYVILGIGAGYYVLDGLLVGARVDGWFGNSPSIYQLTPEVRYVINALPSLKPYVGAYYSRTFYEGLPDLDALGARVGVYIPLGGRVFLGGGIAYERLQDCDESVYRDCSRTYPELSLMFSF
jgi:hypothetical protein